MKKQMLSLPEDVMRRILGYLDFLAILNLQKTCPDFRNFIQHLQPESRIFGIQAIVDIDQISFLLDFDEIVIEFNERKMYRIRYKIQGDGILMTWRLRSYYAEKSKFLKNSNLLSTFSHDLQVILSHQKTTVLRYFDLQFRYPKNNDEIMKGEHFKILEIFAKFENLKCKNLNLAARGENEILEVLPYWEPRTLEILKIDVQKRNLDIQNLIYLEQWGGVKEVELVGCSTVAENFEHMKRVQISIQVVTTEMILGFKEVLANSLTLNHVRIQFQHYYTENDLVLRFGPPSIRTDQYEVERWKVWWIRNLNFAPKVIKFEMHERFVEIDEMNIEQVPENEHVFG